jgi:hypothetical protein
MKELKITKIAFFDSDLIKLKTYKEFIKFKDKNSPSLVYSYFNLFFSI